MFGSGPSRRFISVLTPDGPQSLEVIPGGQSGVPGSPYSADQLLTLWLVNDYHTLPQSRDDVYDQSADCQTLTPGSVSSNLPRPNRPVREARKLGVAQPAPADLDFMQND